MSMGHNHISHEIKVKGQKSRLGLGLGSQLETRSMGPRSSVDDSFLVAASLRTALTCRCQLLGSLKRQFPARQVSVLVSFDRGNSSCEDLNVCQM